VTWVEVWSSDEFVVKPESFQPHIEVDASNLSIPSTAKVGSTVYVGDIAIKGTSDIAVRVRAETIVDGQVAHYREWDGISRGKVVGYVGEFTMPDKEVKVQIKVYEKV